MLLHSFHFVTSSPWPLIISLALFNTTASAVCYMHSVAGSDLSLLLSLLLTVFTMALWFRDVLTEGTYLGDHTLDVQAGLGLGMLLFLVTELLIFFSIFWAYFHSALAPVVELAASWPPVGIAPIDPYSLPLLNTVLLLSSGAAITYGHHALVGGSRDGVIYGVVVTVLLALVFTACQGLEYVDAGFTMADGVFGSSFYLATGTHGFHVIVGTIFITIGLWRAYRYHLTEAHHKGFESAILYWHMVDVVWLFLFAALYWWASV